MGDYLDLRIASDLRPGDVIMVGNYPADLLEVAQLPCGATGLAWGVCEEDQMVVSSGWVFGVLGHLNA